MDDADVGRFLKLFTFLPLKEVEAVEMIKGEDINNAKTVLAFEATKITHGEKKALEVWEASASAFGYRGIDSQLFPSSTIPRSKVANDLSGMPTSLVDKEVLEKGIAAFELFAKVGLCSSRGEARRLINQRGGYINGVAVSKYDDTIGFRHVENGSIVLRSGKKKYHQIKVK